MKFWSWIWKLLLVIIALIVVAITVVVVDSERYHRYGSPAIDRQKQETALKPLVQSHATREEVTRTLKMEFFDYSVGSTNRPHFDMWLSREPTNVNAGLHDGAARYPGLFYHSTSDTMTWLFFDSDGRLQNYYLCEQ